jgi:hypothetical protein
LILEKILSTRLSEKHSANCTVRKLGASLMMSLIFVRLLSRLVFCVALVRVVLVLDGCVIGMSRLCLRLLRTRLIFSAEKLGILFLSEFRNLFRKVFAALRLGVLVESLLILVFRSMRLSRR